MSTEFNNLGEWLLKRFPMNVFEKELDHSYVLSMRDCRIRVIVGGIVNFSIGEMFILLDHNPNNLYECVSNCIRISYMVTDLRFK